jgi:transcriptional regulator with XRE-family HTH domain
VSAAQVQRHRPPGTTDDLARRLRRCRVAANLRQIDLAELAGIGLHRLGHLERGASLPTPQEVDRITWATGTTGQSAELLAMAGARRPIAIELIWGDA